MPLIATAVRVKSSAAGFDLAKPSKGTFDGFFHLESPVIVRGVVDHVDRHNRVHQRDGSDHFVLERASRTA